jgi:hypothetical protein
MKNKILVIVVLLVASISVGHAKNFPKGNEPKNELNNKVTGLVIDKSTGELLAGVLVKIEELDEEAYTDFEGKFEFHNIKPGDYSISCNMVSYENLKREEVEIGSAEKEITLRLSPVEGTSLLNE